MRNLLLFLSILLGQNLILNATPSTNMRTATTHDCQGILFDNGGEHGSYSNHADQTFTIAPGAFIIDMKFEYWDLEAGYDFLYIYDGENTDAPLIGVYSATSPEQISTHNGAVTLRFVSDYSVTKGGFKATWSSGGGACSGLIPAPIAEFRADNTTPVVGELVRFSDLTIGSVDTWEWTFEGGQPSTSTKQHPQVTYSTPGTYAVTLKSTNFAGANEATKMAYITVTAEDLGTSFNLNTMTTSSCTGTLYDAGGADANYKNYEDYTFTISPEGAYGLILTFEEWNVEGGYDFLYIYDGTDTKAPLLGVYSATTPGVIESKNNALTLRFVSDYSVNEAGFKASWTSYGRGCGVGPHFRMIETEETAQTAISNMKVFPNPATSFVTVELPNDLTDATITIMDAQGRILNQKMATANMTTLNVEALPQGVYFINVMTETDSQVQQFIKQ